MQYDVAEGFSQRLRIAMAAKNVSRAALARHVGVTQAAVQKWAHGVMFPSSSKLVTVAKHLGVSLDFLMGPPLDLNAIAAGELAAARAVPEGA